MRIRNALMNMISGAVGQVLIIALGFVTRTVFLWYLSVELLGLNGLFSNILSIFSLANLGIGTAITFSLYKPIAENDTKKVTYLSNLLRKVYYVIGGIILLLGISIIPFLDILVKTDVKIDNLLIIYLIFLFNYVFPYFLGYSYRSVATAHQKEYIYLTTYSISVIVCDILRIIALLITQNYLVFILIQTVINIAMYLTVKYRVYGKYPYLRDKVDLKIDKEEKKGIIQNIKGSICYNFGYVITNGTDNILLSAFIGIKSVGYISNYLYIITAIQSIVGQVFSSLIASIGNLNVSATEEKKKETFFVLFFASWWVYGFCSICLFILMKPFISLWLGKDFIVDQLIIGTIVFNFFLTGMQKAAVSFRSAMGLFWYGKYRPLLSAGVNLVTSLILVKFLGAWGVFIGTLISILAVEFWYDPYIVCKHGINISMKKYMGYYLRYLITFIIAAILTYFISGLIPFSNEILKFIVVMAVCAVVPNSIFAIFYGRTVEFKYLLNVARKIISRKI